MKPMTDEEFRRREAEAQERERRKQRSSCRDRCVVCGQRLGIPGGMAGTDMCGPCCTGEGDSIEEIGETW